MSESFNNWIINERFMLLLTMLQEMHSKLMSRMRERRDEMLNTELQFGMVSDYYKREKYLATYKYSLEAMKGEEYWDFHGGETMLPPDIPKKLRGRPKKLRRREAWEGGTRSATQPSQGVILQRFSNKRIMHCSNCGDAGHRVSNCPTKEQGNQHKKATKEASNKNKVPPAKKKSAREMKRQKLNPRGGKRNVKPVTEESQTGTSKGKKKITPEKQEDDFEDITESIWDLAEETYATMEEERIEDNQAENVQENVQKNAAKNGEETAEENVQEKHGEAEIQNKRKDKLPFLKIFGLDFCNVLQVLLFIKLVMFIRPGFKDLS
ncbi:hypothetical protein POM88_048389 [Heracleum sosnowskyi]|uniref:CCHC-type domain-containing protein n=1 Tax=Heracleum sosnowskyi TaxID=360622 RepID=A0AAD8GV66_9APIA|nr:hypothetical protein POM88_048389 [Heracleum sosnowskyi]